MLRPLRILLDLTILASSVAFSAFGEESIQVTVAGTLRTGIVAIGAETTGTTITARNITWELDFGKNEKLRAESQKYNNEQVMVTGLLELRRGVEIKERWIVIVTSLKPVEKSK